MGCDLELPQASRQIIDSPGFKNLQTKGSGNGKLRVDADDESDAARSHDRSFNTATAWHITIKVIENLCKAKIRHETGA